VIDLRRHLAEEQAMRAEAEAESARLRKRVNELVSQRERDHKMTRWLVQANNSLRRIAEARERECGILREELGVKRAKARYAKED
jgi:hypothetical protein